MCVARVAAVTVGLDYSLHRMETDVGAKAAAVRKWVSRGVRHR